MNLLESLCTKLFEILELGNLKFWNLKHLKFWKVDTSKICTGNDEEPSNKSSKCWIWISYLSKNMKWKFGIFSIFRCCNLYFSIGVNNCKQLVLQRCRNISISILKSWKVLHEHRWTHVVGSKEIAEDVGEGHECRFVLRCH